LLSTKERKVQERKVQERKKPETEVSGFCHRR
jgi:hypothetical protein